MYDVYSTITCLVIKQVTRRLGVGVLHVLRSPGCPLAMVAKVNSRILDMAS
jgi:hypothetical protein